MKHVWILNHYAQEPGGAGGTRHYSLSRHLTKHSWRATVIAASVELNTGRQRLDSSESKRLDLFDGVPFLWIRTPQYQGNGFGRIQNMLTYSVRVLMPSVTRGLDRPDVIVGSSVHPFAAWSAAMLASRFGVPFVFEVRDLWPQTLVDMERLSPKGFMTRALQYLERWLYRRAERIIVLLPKASDYIVPLGIAPEKIVWIPNGVELVGYSEPEQPKEKSSFTLMYFGAHGQANDLDCLLRAMVEVNKSMPNKPLILRLIGDGPLKKSLQQQAADLGLDNIRFEDPAPKNAIPQVAAEADAFVIMVKDLPRLYRFGISMNKIFDYFAAARPIIMASGAVNNPSEESGAGITVLPGDPVEFAKAILSLVEMPIEQRILMGRSGRAYVEKHHSYEMLAAHLASILEEVLVARQ